MKLSLKAFKKHGSLLLKAETLKLFPAFYGRLNFQKDLAIILITERCNLRCIMCNQWSKKPREELTTNEWKDMLYQLKEYGISELHFTGGEPLLRNDLSLLIKHASDLKFTIGITTNGYFLTDALMKRLVDVGLSYIAVSIDAVGEEYEKIRGVKNTYEQVEKSLNVVSEYKKKRSIIPCINYTLMKPSLSHFYKVKKLADSLDIPVAVCLLDDTPYFFSVKQNKDKFWLGKESKAELDELVEFLKSEIRKNPGSLILTTSALKYITGYFEDPVQKDIPCVASQTRIFILPDGSIMGGCLSMEPWGNMKDSKLKDIVEKKVNKASSRNMFYKNCPGCSCGYIYNLRYHLPSAISHLNLVR